ncbi:hypothetical protein ACHAWF_003551 [Thalassiosira exigua]
MLHVRRMPRVKLYRQSSRASPKCLAKKESLHKWLPTHIACLSNAPADVIEYLAHKYAKGTLDPDIRGRLPLHYACSNGASIDVLMINRLSGLHADSNDWLPLHVAACFGASTEVVKELVSMCPAAAVMKTKEHNTPIKLAEKMKTNNEEEVIALVSDVTVAGYVMQSGWSHAPVPIIARAA